jgi:hypothetical protein
MTSQPDDLPTDAAPADAGEYPGMPLWVKVAGIVLLVLVLVVALVLAFGPGEHGPGRHLAASVGLDAVVAGDRP